MPRAGREVEPGNTDDGLAVSWVTCLPAGTKEQPHAIVVLVMDLSDCCYVGKCQGFLIGPAQAHDVGGERKSF